MGISFVVIARLMTSLVVVDLYSIGEIVKVEMLEAAGLMCAGAGGWVQEMMKGWTFGDC